MTVKFPSFINLRSRFSIFTPFFLQSQTWLGSVHFSANSNNAQIRVGGQVKKKDLFELETEKKSVHPKIPPWLCFSNCQGESLTYQWTYSPT